jgi:hypothetical protein
MINPGWLAIDMERNHRVITRLTDGLTHADSLLVPPSGGNCLNWVLGHIAVSRDRMLALVGAAPLWDASTAAPYVTGSEPLTAESAGVLPLERLLADLAASSEALITALRGKSPDDMLAEVDGAPVGQVVLGLFWHETYHIGQLEQLRRLAGKTEKVFG